MLARFASNIICLTLGVTLVALSLTLVSAGLEWVTLGVGSATVLVAAAAFPARGRGAAQRYLDVLSALLGSWMIVAACAFAGDALRWLSFAGAASLCALGLAGLIAHEALMERAVVFDARTAATNGRGLPESQLPDRSHVSAW